jgi:hypothetical protein
VSKRGAKDNASSHSGSHTTYHSTEQICDLAGPNQHFDIGGQLIVPASQIMAKQKGQSKSKAMDVDNGNNKYQAQKIGRPTEVL